MVLDKARIGVSYEPWTYEVSRAKIREYAEALGETDPRYFSDGDDAIAPPTFASLFTIIQGTQAMMADEQLGAHWSLVHGSQRYLYGTRPMRPGDVLTCTPRIAEIRSRGVNEMLTIEVDCRFADGEPAVLSTATIVLLGSAPSDDAEEA